MCRWGVKERRVFVGSATSLVTGWRYSLVREGRACASQRRSFKKNLGLEGLLMLLLVDVSASAGVCECLRVRGRSRLF